MVSAVPVPYHRPSRQNVLALPIVCAACTKVHRVSPKQLDASVVSCPHCGANRDAAALRPLMPRSMRARY